MLTKFVAQLKSKVDNMSAKKRSKTAATGMYCYIYVICIYDFVCKL